MCCIKRIETLQVDGDGVKGRPKKRWREVLREDMKEKGLCREDAWDRCEGGGKYCGKAISEVNPSTLGKTTSLK